MADYSDQLNADFDNVEATFPWEAWIIHLWSNLQKITMFWI